MEDRKISFLEYCNSLDKSIYARGYLYKVPIWFCASIIIWIYLSNNLNDVVDVAIISVNHVIVSFFITLISGVLTYLIIWNRKSALRLSGFILILIITIVMVIYNLKSFQISSITIEEARIDILNPHFFMFYVYGSIIFDLMYCNIVFIWKELRKIISKIESDETNESPYDVMVEKNIKDKENIESDPNDARSGIYLFNNDPFGYKERSGKRFRSGKKI